VAARAAARCAQCGDAAEECGRGESEVEDEKEGSDSELRALKVVAVVKEEVEAEAVEVKERSSAPASAAASAGGKCGERAASEESGEKGAGSWGASIGGGASMCMASEAAGVGEEGMGAGRVCVSARGQGAYKGRRR